LIIILNLRCSWHCSYSSSHCNYKF